MAAITLDEMESLIRTYFDGCSEADHAKMTACFVPEAIHSFPPGMYGGPFVGAATIADRWSAAVAQLGSCWTVDSFVGDARRGEAVIEWTHFKQRAGTVLRGVEWYRFDLPTGLIAEIRAYYASPQDPSLDALELDGFDYAARGYATEPPARFRVTGRR
jgi:methyltransferase